MSRGELSEAEIARKILDLCDPYSNHATLLDAATVVRQVRRRQFSDVQRFYQGGLLALRRADLRRLLEQLAKDLDERISDVRRAAESETTIPSYNKRFTGRVDELIALRERLKDDRTGVIAGVHGLGGIGKTELAFTYAHAFAGAYPGGRFLVQCEGKSNVKESALSPGDFFRDRIRDEDLINPESHFAAIAACLRERLKSHGHVLLVLDNVCNPSMLEARNLDCLTTFGPKLHLLATTRLPPPPSDRSNWLTLGRDRPRFTGGTCRSPG